MDSSWTAPPVERPDPVRTAAERDALEMWLDNQRETLLFKCAGLSADELKQRAVPPSGLSLLGLVRHMTEVERWWFRLHAAGEEVGYVFFSDDDPDSDFNDLETADAQGDIEAFLREVAAARKAVRGKDLEDVVTCESHEHMVRSRNIRSIYLHMISEYARHNGHADLLRERIDGSTGD